jgi:hypothetical protein
VKNPDLILDASIYPYILPKTESNFRIRSLLSALMIGSEALNGSTPTFALLLLDTISSFYKSRTQNIISHADYLRNSLQ